MKFLPEAFEVGESPKATPSVSMSIVESSLCTKTRCPMEGSQLSQWDGAVCLQHYTGLGSTVQEKMFSHCFGRGREGKDPQYSPCWTETYVESIRKLMQHKYHMVRADLLSSFNGRQQSKQHRWLHLWPHSVQIQNLLSEVF